MNFWLHTCPVVTLLSIGGCMTAQNYDGPQLPRDEVARISGDFRISAGAPISVILRQVDGRTLSAGANAVDVLPGEHTLLVDCKIAETASINRHSLKVDVVPGARYRLVAETAPGLRECSAVHLESVN